MAGAAGIGVIEAGLAGVRRAGPGGPRLWLVLVLVLRLVLVLGLGLGLVLALRLRLVLVLVMVLVLRLGLSSPQKLFAEKRRKQQANGHGGIVG